MLKKRILSMLLLTTLLLTTGAQAMDLRFSTNRPMLLFRAGQAECSVLCKGDGPSDTVDVTLTLYEDGNYVDSWSKSGKGQVSISGKHKAVSVKLYRLTSSYSINGGSRMSASAHGTCP